MFRSFGFTAGPILGGICSYTFTNLSEPFALFGATLLAFCVSTFFLIPTRINEGPHKCDQVVEKLPIYMKQCSMWVGLTSVFLSGITSSFILTSLRDYTRHYDSSQPTDHFNILYILICTSAAFSAPLWGRLCDNQCHPSILIICVSFLSILCLIFLGCKDLLHIYPTRELTVLGLILCGISQAGFWGCGYCSCLRSVKHVGVCIDCGSICFLAGLLYSTASLGAFLGAAVGGILSDLIGFSLTCLVLICLTLCLILMCLLSSIINMCENMCGKSNENIIYEKITLISYRNRNNIYYQTFLTHDSYRLLT